MTAELQKPSDPPPSPVVLSANERRILGVLVEKAKTTPDTYPLSVNALVTGSNQKSNRDPILTLTDLDVEEALASAQQKGLTIKITGGRVIRWRHSLYEAWKVDKVELAVLAELLLRGPQTEGELRARASRMEPIDDLDALRPVLRRLAERRLVVYLSPEGRRGTMLTHGFHSPKELERLRERHKDGAALPAVEEASRQPTSSPVSSPAPSPVQAASPAQEDKLASLETSLREAHTEITALRNTVSELQQLVATLGEQLRGLKEALGA
jgi:uncharacterized protein YceH (UPF0502 family)